MDSSDVGQADRQTRRYTIAWFNEHLLEPSRFNRSKSKGHYRRKTRGISWFQHTATHCISRMYELKRIVESHGYAVTVIREDRPGFVVYEDKNGSTVPPTSEISPFQDGLVASGLFKAC